MGLKLENNGFTTIKLAMAIILLSPLTNKNTVAPKTTRGAKLRCLPNSLKTWKSRNWGQEEANTTYRTPQHLQTTSAPGTLGEPEEPWGNPGGLACSHPSISLLSPPWKQHQSSQVRPSAQPPPGHPSASPRGWNPGRDACETWPNKKVYIHMYIHMHM